MRVVILAGGRGTRISEESDTKPKPMIDVGGRPLLWHIMKIYAAQGYDDFLIAGGYKVDVIKRFFYEEAQLAGDLFVDSRKGELMHFAPKSESWRVRIVNTGLDTNTGGRILRLKPHLGDEPFMVTYGDGVSNVDLKALAACHAAGGKHATITAVRPPARFGGISFDGDAVTGFAEKPQTGEGLDQWRLRGSGAGKFRLSRIGRRCRCARARALRGAGKRRPHRRLSSRRLLAMRRHAP